MKKLIKKIEELYVIWNAKRIWKEVEKDEKAMSAERSQEEIDRSLEIILETMREHESEKEKKRLAEEQELIRLGRRYKKSLQRRKYILLAAVLILVLSFSINCFGSVDKMLHKLDLKIFNREREVADTDGIKVLEHITEEEAFAEIENIFGFDSIRLDYLPENTGFLEMNILSDVPEINILYGDENKVRIINYIVPNYRDGSWAKDIEDEWIQSYVETIKDVEISIDEYLVSSGESRWLIQFEYKNIYYWLYVIDVDQYEIQKLIEGICFL